MTSINSSKEVANDETSNHDASSSNHSHDDDDDRFTFRSRKSYPQRNNRPKLNYRDLERGMYDRHELRQSMWALSGSTVFSKSQKPLKNAQSNYDDGEDDDETMDSSHNNENDDDDNDETIPADGSEEKSTESKDQMHRRLWCICRKPWDHERLMLRCDTCSNWYHGDCIGITKEQGRMIDLKGDPFICPPCQGVSQPSATKPSRASDESIMIKRKRPEGFPATDLKMKDRHETITSTKTAPIAIEPTKRAKTGIFFQRDSNNERQIHCIAPSCSNWAKPGWVYCSGACIRRHINDTLQAIQRSKGANNDNPPTREDILLYENRTKKVLNRDLVPKVEDLCTWINQNPSYEIVKPALRQSILLNANESRASTNPKLNRSPSVNKTTNIPKSSSTPNTTKAKLTWAPVVPTSKPVPIKKAPITLTKTATPTTSSSTSNTTNTADIRSKVPNALYDKLLMRINKSGETSVSNDDIRTITEKIEEEMFRVYGKVDNSYKNKFRSLLANISNMNNNFFYKHILSREVTAKQIVAMKPEDMLPPEEKVKRKDEFEKEVQMIIKAAEQTAEEMARRARIKVTRQGLVETDSVLPNYSLKEEKPNEQTEKLEEKTANPEKKKESTAKLNQPSMKTTTKNKVLSTVTSNSSSSKKSSVQVEKTIESVPSPTKSSVHDSSTEQEKIKEIIQPIPKIPSPPSEDINPVYPVADLDDDYIEPESPTGIDALIYDDDEDVNNISINSTRSSIAAKTSKETKTDRHVDHIPPLPMAARDDYNPLTATKPKADSNLTYEPTPIGRSNSVQIRWRGVINFPDIKINCQSSRIFGEGEYLINDIPEQLGILGRLRFADLWDYVRDSLPVRDVIILSLTPSNVTDEQPFLRYIDTMRQSGRAAVLNKRSEPSAIRDMYILPSEVKDCSSSVVSAFSLNDGINLKQIFMIIVGSSKRSLKSNSRVNESAAVNQLTYKPVPLQEPSSIRDPRLSRTKDPRITASTPNEPIVPPQLPVNVNPIFSSRDQALKKLNEALEQIRQMSSIDSVSAIAISMIDYLKLNRHEDLCAQFTQEVSDILSKWQSQKEVEKPEAPTVIDNLNEENMDVDEESEKKQFVESEFNDVDYRFLDQDMDHRLAGRGSSQNGPT